MADQATTRIAMVKVPGKDADVPDPKSGCQKGRDDYTKAAESFEKAVDKIAKKIAEAHEIADAYFKFAEKTADKKIKELDELDRHMSNVSSYKPKP